MPLPSPEELRQQAAEAKERIRREAEERRRQEALEREERLERTRQEYDYTAKVRYIERAVQSAVALGRSDTAVELGRFSSYLENDEHYQALRPLFDNMSAAFEAYGARIRVQGEIEWYGGESGPGPNTVFLDLDWSA